MRRRRKRKRERVGEGQRKEKRILKSEEKTKYSQFIEHANIHSFIQPHSVKLRVLPS